MKKNFLFFTFAALLVQLCISRAPADAQEWSWQIDHSYFSPNLAPDMETIGSIYANGLCDLNGDDMPEFVLLCVRQDSVALRLALMEGDFPDIRWTLQPDFFPAIDYAPDIWFNIINFCDLDGDDAVEIILNGRFVLRNSGDFDNPDWQRSDHLIPELDADDCILQICDWDNDRMLDVIAATYPLSPDSMWLDQGFYRYELTEENGWDSLGYTEIQTGLLQQVADLDQDGDIDRIEGSVVLYDMNPPRRDFADYYLNGVQFVFNEGTPDNPRWSDPELYEDFYRPIPFDLNSDGCLDIVDGWSYHLNRAEDNPLLWDREVRWRNLSGRLYAAGDFVGDEHLEMLCGRLYSRSFMDHRWRLVQEELTPAGWRDAQFFGNDFAEWGSGFTDLWAIRTGDFLQNGQIQIVLAKSVGMGVCDPSLTLFADQDEGEGWDWQAVEGFFDGLIDPEIYVFKPAFGDFDHDGDQDVALMREAPYDSFLIHFFEYRDDRPNDRWIIRPEWSCAIFDTLQVRSLASGDFDDDGSCDLIIVGNDDLRLHLFRNISRDAAPDWILEEDAFTHGGPDRASDIVAVDVNLDGKPDLIAGGLYLNQTVSRVDDDPMLPCVLNLSIYPNPFNSKTAITYTLPAQSLVTLSIYNTRGQLVDVLVDRLMPAGRHSLVWDGSRFGAGVYFIGLYDGPGNLNEMRKILMLK